MVAIDLGWLGNLDLGKLWGVVGAGHVVVGSAAVQALGGTVAGPEPVVLGDRTAVLVQRVLQASSFHGAVAVQVVHGADEIWCELRLLAVGQPIGSHVALALKHKVELLIAGKAFATDLTLMLVMPLSMHT